LRAKDFGADMLWLLSAPISYPGNVGAASGGALTFALQSDSASKPPLARGYADLQLIGRVGLRLDFSPNIAPGTEWTSHGVPLVAIGARKIGSFTGLAAIA
jgi:hypothetical protein